jgi:microtubule-associated protein-like 1/2
MPDVAEAPLAILRHGKGTRAVICVGFNADCTRLVTVCGDDGHTVSLWDWNAGPLVNASLPGGTRAGLRLWQSRGYQNTPPAVRGAMFTPDLERKDVLLTFGSKHIKFWTPPAREPRPPGGVGDADAERAFQKLPWRARSGQWVPNATVEDVLCAAFLPWVRAEEVSDADADDDAASVVSGPPGEDDLARGVNLVTGSPKGRIMFWEKGDGAVPVKIVPGSDWHKAGVSALALSSDKRLLLSGDKAGGVMCWAMNTSYATIVAPLGGVFLVENPPKPLPPTPPPSVSASEVWLEGDDEYPGPWVGVRG